MPIKKVKFIAFVLVALLAAGWMQPVFAHACASVGRCDEAAFSVGVSAMSDDGCVSTQAVSTHHKPAGHDGSGHEAGHGTPAKAADGKPCMMKACSLSAYVPVLTQHAEFSAISAESGFMAACGDVCVLSPHLSALFRPPRSITTLWG